MPDTAKSNLRGVAFALAAFAIFSTHDVIVKVLGISYSTFQIIFFGVLFSFPLVMLMLMKDTTQGNLLPRHPWWTALRTVSAVISGFCVFYAFSTLPLAQVYSIIFTMPLLITVLSIPILGETVGRHRWGAVAVGLVGVVVVLRPGGAELGLGHLSALFGAFFGALAAIIVRKIGNEERNAVLLLYPMMANFLVMAAVMPFVYEPIHVEGLGLQAVMAFFAFAGGLCLIQAYKSGDATIVAPMQYSQMVWAAIYGGLFFDEVPDTVTWIGAGIIIASGLYIVLRENFGGTSTNRPVVNTKSRIGMPTSPRVQMLQSIVRRPQKRAA
ncbi:DMT family transporter [Marinibacterium profundimaris]|uniref:Membrane protein n=1 Tax=Marinibacterium profundimaris TaxID=1679460 RepID=A0A225NNI3_9RHOB|nr:DMT family transporter [Marinibacterium profundimaris]OWU75943.1 membrane protein [Marinibacterium profundimaris]